MAESRPVTRAASKKDQNYGAQPVTTIRYKFEKSRGYIAKSKAAHDIEDEFADFPMAPALPGTEAFIGTPVRRVFVNPNTPLMELRNRAASVRAALDASMPRPPIVSCALEGRELALAEEAALAYEPTGRDIMTVLGNIANNMVVKDDLRVEMTEALHPVYAHLELITRSRSVLWTRPEFSMSALH